MKVTYAPKGFDPKDVTGKYVRCSGRSPDYTFIVFETATCYQKGQFYGMAGLGYTLREYQAFQSGQKKKQSSVLRGKNDRPRTVRTGG